MRSVAQIGQRHHRPCGRADAETVDLGGQSRQRPPARATRGRRVAHGVGALPHRETITSNRDELGLANELNRPRRGSGHNTAINSGDVAVHREIDRRECGRPLRFGQNRDGRDHEYPSVARALNVVAASRWRSWRESRSNHRRWASVFDVRYLPARRTEQKRRRPVTLAASLRHRRFTFVAVADPPPMRRR